MENLKPQIRQVVLELLPNVRSEEIQEDRDIFSLGMTSVNAMSLIVKLQNLLGVKFEVSEMKLENFRTLEGMAALIEKKKKDR
jgi:acyl carrier protein